MTTVLHPAPPETDATIDAAIGTAPPRWVPREPIDLLEEDPVSREDDAAVLRWLQASMIAAIAAIVIGGITRLTESGLSITEWKPIAGILPPLGAEAWHDAYARYLQIPEAQTVHRGITLEQFKNLFWWEWVHRLVARGVGLVLAVPFFVLLMRRRIRPEHRLRLANLPILTALQGAMGWHMVKSGLTERTDVSQYRLVAHLAIALLLLTVIVWTAATLARSLRASAPASPASDGTRRAGQRMFPLTLALAALCAVTVLAGGFVAGLDAGRFFNTFPLMGGAIVPADYLALAPAWRNAFENPAAVQFHHRMLGIATVLAALTLWWSLRDAELPAAPQRAVRVVAAVAIVQFSLGVATLLLVVPIPLAALHQLGGVSLFIATLWAANEVRALC